MPSPAAARASVSVPTAAGLGQEVTAARVSVSSPTRSSPSETPGARWGPKTDKVASPCEGATAKSAGLRECATAAMDPPPAPAQNRDRSGPIASPSGVSVAALTQDPTPR
ncbi:hypothetical protein PAL_GLEAN10011910 [Pteropus alecto]|uniref:Uncharacterized protein n=1 Tax=Pteropus alecto TaxID=9402 RepID=L5KH24_PTEAL|nr:hypothetical protein PAL_GLEAN10011910 [Pteropus alecto]